MDAPHDVLAIEIGERARHAQHPVIAARRQPHPLRRVGQEFRSRRIGTGCLVQHLAFRLRIGAQAVGRIARALDVARRGDSGGDFGIAFGGGRQGQIAGGDRGDLDMDIDAVEQGAGDA
jgi:hypothetical protein